MLNLRREMPLLRLARGFKVSLRSDFAEHGQHVRRLDRADGFAAERG